VSTPNVFIIESLKFEDEDAGYHEEHFISHILRLSGREVRYYYIRTKAELEEVLEKFEDSGFRYLHLSCHGNAKGMALTLDNLPVVEMGEMFRPFLDDRRVFLSACELMTPELAANLLEATSCHSVIGPAEVVDVDQAALFWASVYHLMFRNDAQSMKLRDLRESVSGAAELFGVPMRYFTRSKSSKKGWKEVDVGPSR
jgi:hypothetical protein